MNNKFPGGFLWGTATAAHQVEGNNIHNEWWLWETSHKDIPNSSFACNQYNLYKDDFKLIKDVLHNNAHRLSIEWSRIEQEEGKFNKNEIDHYKEVLQELKQQNIKVMLTLNHFTNPRWFIAKGGWEKKINLKYFKRFVALVVKECGELVDYWCIVNEPNVYTAMSYIKGFWPPEKKNIFLAANVFLNLARSHNLAYDIIHQNLSNSSVGSSVNMTFFKGKNFIEKIISSIAEFIVNDIFIHLTKEHSNWIGINSYFFHPINLRELPIINKIRRKDFTKFIYGKRSDLGWTIYPQSIYYVCLETWNKFKLPIIITENGVADKKDVLRPRYIVDNLAWLKQAIDEGVNVLGYFHWTLLDNIEWGLGKKARFGLFKTDYKTMKRIPRKSALIYAKICQENLIAKDLI